MFNVDEAVRRFSVRQETILRAIITYPPLLSPYKILIMGAHPRFHQALDLFIYSTQNIHSFHIPL